MIGTGIWATASLTPSPTSPWAAAGSPPCRGRPDRGRSGAGHLRQPAVRAPSPRTRTCTERAENAVSLSACLEEPFEGRTPMLRMVSAAVTLVFFTVHIASGLVTGGVLFGHIFGAGFRLDMGGKADWGLGDFGQPHILARFAGVRTAGATRRASARMVGRCGA
ncbi:sodium:solute symporter family transporter [Streptomyces puniciscabiei]